MTPKDSQAWEERFLRALARCGVVLYACKLARVSRETVYNRRGEDPGFAARWKVALEEATDVLEREARRRAAEGTLKPVFHQGKECGKVREYSDALLVFLLKAKRPEEFREESLSLQRVMGLFEGMLDILRAEVGEAHARRVAERWQRETLGGMANGHGKAAVAEANGHRE